MEQSIDGLIISKDRPNYFLQFFSDFDMVRLNENTSLEQVSVVLTSLPPLHLYR